MYACIGRQCWDWSHLVSSAISGEYIPLLLDVPDLYCGQFGPWPPHFDSGKNTAAGAANGVIAYVIRSSLRWVDLSAQFNAVYSPIGGELISVDLFYSNFAQHLH